MYCTSCRSVSNIIWDYERGEVVCGNCGTVLDKIYVSVRYDANIEDIEYIMSPKTRPLISSQTKLYLKLLEKALQHGLVIDNSVLMRYFSGKAPLIKVFRRPNKNLTKIIESDDRLKIVIDVINKYPRLASRTESAKVALARIALALTSGDRINPKELSSELGLSEVHIRRLYRAVIECPEFLYEVSKVLTPLLASTP